ncbi:uncharacterized protein PgNI_02683 [Pyricularia grisea]|uniref:Uncharacterized protein n=1 Tax=Pyricularia grisea TaxID=148305 RepID=A0A6P8BB97_PYRGI|nr:uncharacterized protein PgNI_02683 [Pyricularia grisea]TLD13116.1 hypothetical protein PgNI_02683 [Pyricularia grisea]
MVGNFIESGERFNVKLRRLLKYYKGRIFNYKKKTKGKFCTNTGTRFIDIFLGRDYELGNTEKFMSFIRIWNLRLDINCK